MYSFVFGTPAAFDIIKLGIDPLPGATKLRLSVLVKKTRWIILLVLGGRRGREVFTIRMNHRSRALFHLTDQYCAAVHVGNRLGMVYMDCCARSPGEPPESECSYFDAPVSSKLLLCLPSLVSSHAHNSRENVRVRV